MKRGTIVLTPFPFTDLSNYKVRPAVVVSRTDRRGVDAVVAFMTSFTSAPLRASDLAIDPTHPDFAATGLKSAGVVKCDKLATLATAKFLGELGELSSALLKQIDACLSYALEL
jgi:mRNA interferase MazF